MRGFALVRRQCRRYDLIRQLLGVVIFLRCRVKVVGNSCNDAEVATVDKMH